MDKKLITPRTKVIALVSVMLVSGLLINWLSTRGDAEVVRRPLDEVPAVLGDWKQRGDQIKFEKAVEDLLRTTDYTMREYTRKDGRMANIYVGYYGSQRTGATYHSPQNCLPGAGWVMKDPSTVDISTGDGRTFKANRYVIENGIYKEVMIYWYQGRGRTEASEYRDKLNTIWDSVIRRRSDGAMVRVMTTVGHDEPSATAAAIELSSILASQLPTYIPD